LTKENVKQKTENVKIYCVMGEITKLQDCMQILGQIYIFMFLILKKREL